MALALALGSAACASSGARESATPTTTTGAEMPASAPSAASSAPEPREATSDAVGPSTSDPPEDMPGAKLVCRTINRVDGTSELFLEWSGKTARGVIRRTAPSGMVYSQPVRAERYQGTIVVDEPDQTDLASHAAMVVEQNGKLHMRVGAPGQLVSACQ